MSNTETYIIPIQGLLQSIFLEISFEKLINSYCEKHLVKFQ